MKPNHYFLLSLFFISSLALAQKPIFTTAKVKAATVYFSAAEITQTVNVNIPAGTYEIVVKNVADYLNESSIQIAAPSNITVLSVQFTNNYVTEYEIDEKSSSIKSVRDSIKLVEKEIQKVTNAKDSDAKTIELLDKNQQVFGANSGLNVIELMKMVDFYKVKRTELSNSFDILDDKTSKLKKLLADLNNKLVINSEAEDKTSEGKLILQVMNTLAGNVPFEISYLTNTARWAPFYDLRADNVTAPINMKYKAQVLQNSGVDWKKVKLALSSGNPNKNNQAPTMNPWFLNYQAPQNGYLEDTYKADNDGVVVGAMGIKRSEKKVGYASQSIKGGSSQSISAEIIETQLNVTFDIDIPYDILSNGKVHSVDLKEIKLPATYKYYAAPKLDKEAFLLAEISNYGQYNLIKGEANIVFEGLYVGKTVINPNQTTDTLNLSMGSDKKVTINREKVADKSGTKFLSSKKEQTFTYDITIRNNKKEAISMKMEDQYPLSTNKEIEIELLESSNAKVNAETGILTWELNLKANETKKIRFTYKVKYPKDSIIDNL